MSIAPTSRSRAHHHGRSSTAPRTALRPASRRATAVVLLRVLARGHALLPLAHFVVDFSEIVARLSILKAVLETSRRRHIAVVSTPRPPAAPPPTTSFPRRPPHTHWSPRTPIATAIAITIIATLVARTAIVIVIVIKIIIVVSLVPH